MKIIKGNIQREIRADKWHVWQSKGWTEVPEKKPEKTGKKAET